MRFIVSLALTLALLAPATGLAQTHNTEQLRLARQSLTAYGVGVGAGIAGIAPFMGAFLTGFQPESESILPTISFGVLWSLKAVMMLIADDLMNQARSPSSPCRSSRTCWERGQ